MRTDLQLEEGSNASAIQSALPEKQTGRFAKLITRSKLRILLLIALIVGSCLLYFSAFQPDRFGYYRDDAMYVVMAKALSTGRGYHLVSLPFEPAQTKSPPFYPFLLSLIWRVKPQFPQNLIPMMALSVVTTLLFLGLTFRYLLKQEYANSWQAMAVVGLAAINWRTIVLAAGIYSEMPYAAVSVAALYLAEKYAKERGGWLLGSALGVLTGLGFLTRTAGIALLLSIALYFLLHKQRSGILPIVFAGMFVIAWLGWGYVNTPALESTNAGSYESYFQTFHALMVGNGKSALIALLSVIGRNVFGLILISIPVVCLALSYESVLYFGFAFLFIAAGFLRQARGRLRLMHIYVVSYLAIHLLWPYTAFDRFLMPLLPFLLLFLVIELQAVFSIIRKELAAQKELLRRVSAAFIGLALVVLAGASLYNYGLGLNRSLSLATLATAAYPSSDDAEVIEWIKSHTDPLDVLICYRDPLYYLYTNRKAARSSLLREGVYSQSSQAAAEERAEPIFRIIQDNKGRYLVLTQSDFALEYQPEFQRQHLTELLERNPKVFSIVFESQDGRSKIYRINYE